MSVVLSQQAKNTRTLTHYIHCRYVCRVDSKHSARLTLALKREREGVASCPVGPASPVDITRSSPVPSFFHFLQINTTPKTREQKQVDGPLYSIDLSHVHFFCSYSLCSHLLTVAAPTLQHAVASM